MKSYVKIMEYFWLSAAILTFIMVTIMCFKESFSSWVPYYVFTLVALVYYFIRRFMRRRMEKHMQWLADQAKQQQNQNTEQ